MRRAQSGRASLSIPPPQDSSASPAGVPLESGCPWFYPGLITVALLVRHWPLVVESLLPLPFPEVRGAG